MRLFDKACLFFLVIGMVFSMSGCVYAHNQSWDDISEEEKQQIKQELNEVKEDLEQGFSNHAFEQALAFSIFTSIEQAVSGTDKIADEERGR